MSLPTNDEQEMLELINRLRADPQGEFSRLILGTSPPVGVTADVTNAIRYFRVDLNLFQQQMQTYAAAAPLAWNTQLDDAAAQHSAKMIADDSQSHQLPGEQSLGQRLQSAGYDYSWYGENIYAFGTSVLQSQAAFVIDWGGTSGGMQDPPGHRLNLFNINYTEIGIDITPENNTATSVGLLVITEDLGTRLDYAPQFVGVVFRDANRDNFYEAGEGVADATVTATGTEGTFTTKTWSTGGYQLAVPKGSYTLTFSGNGLSSLKSIQAVLGGSNVKIDDIDSTPTASDVVPTVLSVTASPSSGDAVTGNLVTLLVTMSEAVVVSGGTPSLLLNDGGAAAYDATHSTATVLTFDYTVQSGQSTGALAVTGFSTNGATIQDATGNGADLSGARATLDGLAVNIGTAPDLVADTLSLGSTLVVPNGSTMLSYHVANDGTGTAGVSTSKVYLSTDSTIAASDTLLATVNDPSLSSTGNALDRTSVTLPAGLAAGNYWIGVIADANGQVAESDESNNTSIPVRITLPSAQDQSEYLYVAYFGRAAEPGGLAYWQSQLTYDSSRAASDPSYKGPATFRDSASGFATTAEAAGKYALFGNIASGGTPTASDTQAFLNTIYQNLFNRAPDAGGLTYWSGIIQQRLLITDPPQRVLQIGAILVDIIGGAFAGSDAGYLKDQATLQNKLAVAEHFSADLISAGSGDCTASIAILAGVNSTPSSVTQGNALSDGEVSGSNGLVVTGAPVSTAATWQSDSHVKSFSVTDTAANVGAALTALNADSKLSSVSVLGTSSGDTFDLKGFSKPVTIDLGADTASVNAGLNAASLLFLGSPDSIVLGSGAVTILYALTAGSGIETVDNFVLGQDELNVDLLGASSSVLRAADTTVNGLHAISIYSGADPTYGVVLAGVNGGLTAVTILSSHTTFSAGHALIT